MYCMKNTFIFVVNVVNLKQLNIKIMDKVFYYILKKELPSAKIGDCVNIYDADGRRHLFINGIDLPFDFPKKYPDWFHPVYRDEHEKICRTSFINYAIENYGKSESEAIKIFESLC